MLSDTFDAMTTDRPYRRAMSLDQALSEVELHAGTQFDPDLARAWIDMVDSKTGPDGSTFPIEV